MVVFLLCLILIVLLLGRERFLRIAWRALVALTMALVLAAIAVGIAKLLKTPGDQVIRVGTLTLAIAFLAIIVLQVVLEVSEWLGLGPSYALARSLGLTRDEFLRRDQEGEARARAAFKERGLRGFFAAARDLQREEEERIRATKEAAEAQVEVAEAQRNLMDLVTGVTRRKERDRLPPEEKARFEAVTWEADAAATARRAALPPAERIATEVELTALTLEAVGSSFRGVTLTAEQRGEIEATNRGAVSEASVRLAAVTTEQRTTVEALLALLLTTSDGWEQILSADSKTYEEAVAVASRAIADAAVQRALLPVPVELRDAVEHKLVALLSEELDSDNPGDLKTCAQAVLRRHVWNVLCVSDDGDDIEWNEKPGCFERHLQRRLRNPLFPPEMRHVSAREVRAARERDERDAEELRVQAARVAADLRNLDQYAVDGAIPYASLGDLRKRLDDVLWRAAEVGGAGPEELAAATMRIYETVRRVMVDLGKEHDGVREAQLKADAVREATQPFLTDPFLAQANRADGPIGERWFVPSLLSEAPETIRRVMVLLETTPDVEGEAERIRLQGVHLITDCLERSFMAQRDADVKISALRGEVEVRR